MTSAGLLDGMPELMRVLSGTPHPDEVAEILVTGPGRQFDAQSGVLLWRSHTELIVVGVHGRVNGEVAGLDLYTIEADYPVCTSFRESEVIVESLRSADARYPLLRLQSSRWKLTAARFPDGSVITAPVLVRGRAIGAYVLICSTNRQHTSLELAMLRAVSSALGLWMHHPDKGLFVDDAPADAALTDRQVRILRLVAAGRSNAAIAAYLGYSPSTVKQELQRVRVLLETVDRDASARRARELGLLPEIS